MLLAVAAAGAGCARRPPAPAPPPPPPAVQEERLEPTTTIELEVAPPRWTDSADQRATFVEGNVRNRGSKPTREIRVFVSGLDANGNVVSRADGLPTPQLIAPGSSARYLVRLPNDPAIKTYHVEAIGR